MPAAPVSPSASLQATNGETERVKFSPCIRYVLGSFAAAALLTACGGSQPPIGAPGAMPQSRAIAPTPKLGRPLTSTSYTVLYRFHKGDVNGEHPQAGLIDVSGTLYGTT